MKLSADTITDEQIRKLVDASRQALDFETYRIAQTALEDDRYTGGISSAARARCAEILNARGDAQ